MASNPYVKSLIWLVCSGGIGYGLLLLTAPSENKLERIRATSGGVHLTEEERKKLVLLQHLRDNASGQTTHINTPKKEN